MPVQIFHTSNVFETRFSKWCSVTSTLFLNEMFDLAKYFQLSTPYIWASTDSTKRPTPIFLLSHSSNQDWMMKFSEIERMSKINTRMGGKKQWLTITSLAQFKILKKVILSNLYNSFCHSGPFPSWVLQTYWSWHIE